MTVLRSEGIARIKGGKGKIKKKVMAVILAVAMAAVFAFGGCGEQETGGRAEGAAESTGETTEDFQPDVPDSMQDEGKVKEITVVAKETKYNSNGSINRWDEYEYDSAGNETKYIKYNSDGSIDYWVENEYITINLE